MSEARKKSKFEMLHDEVESGKEKFFDAFGRSLRRTKQTKHHKQGKKKKFNFDEYGF